MRQLLCFRLTKTNCYLLLPPPRTPVFLLVHCLSSAAFLVDLRYHDCLLNRLRTAQIVFVKRIDFGGFPSGQAIPHSFENPKGVEKETVLTSLLSQITEVSRRLANQPIGS